MLVRRRRCWAPATPRAARARWLRHPMLTGGGGLGGGAPAGQRRPRVAGAVRLAGPLGGGRDGADQRPRAGLGAAGAGAPVGGRLAAGVRHHRSSLFAVIAGACHTLARLLAVPAVSRMSKTARRGQLLRGLPARPDADATPCRAPSPRATARSTPRSIRPASRSTRRTSSPAPAACRGARSRTSPPSTSSSARPCRTSA